MRHLNAKGFTLIELLLVVAILGIFSTLVSLRYNQMTAEQELDRAAYQLEQDIRQMQRLSMQQAEGTFTAKKIKLSISSTSYEISDATQTPPWSKAVTLPSGITLQSGQAALYYNPLDYDANAFAKLRLYAPASNSKNRYIFIAKTTGRIRIAADDAVQSGEQ